MAKAAVGVPVQRDAARRRRSGRALPGLRGVEHPGGGARRRPATGRGPRPAVAAVRIAQVDAGVGRPAPPAGRARPGARRRAGPRLGHPARRRARDRQVHAAAPDGGGAGPGRLHRALRVGRGVGPAGAAPGRAARRPARPAVVRRPTRRSPTSIAHLDQVRPEVFVVDSIQTVHDPELGVGAGQRRTGPRVGAPPRAGGQGARRRHGARRPRHEGRRRWPGPACSSTSSTRCCPSRATATTPSGCCGRSSTASAPPTISASSR